MSSSPSAPVLTTTIAPTTSTTSSAIGLELMDAKGSHVDSPIPAIARADISLNNNINLSTTAISHNVYPISTPLEHGAQQPRSNPEDMSVIQESLDNLKLDKDHTTKGGVSPRNGAPDSHTSSEKAPTNALESSTELEAGTPDDSAPIRLMSRNSDTGSYSKSSVISDGADSSPVIVVSSQSQSPEPFADQLKAGIPALIDEPDERLLSALETPRDRLFVIRLEQDVINFIQENTCEIFDLPPINAYHRLLAHKMAEYYRLTHVADATGSSVRLYRGQYARIPPVRLSEKPNAALLQNPITNGTAPTMKIMQRRSRSEKGTDTPPENSTPKKPSSETSSGDGSSRTNSREERELMYERARARIFKDFVEPPPETPPPTKSNDKQRKQAQPDDFSGRSQFFPVLSPPIPPVSQHYYPQYENPVIQFQNNTHMPVAPRFNPNTPNFNPNTPSFNPNGNFSPQPFIPPMANRSFQPPTDRSFPTANQPHIAPMYPQHQQHQQQQQHPQHHQQHQQQQHQQQQHQQQHHQQQHQQQQPPHQQQRNGFYDQTISFNNSHPQQQQQPQSSMPNPPYTNLTRFMPQQPPHPQHQQQTNPPNPASGNRHPYTSPSNYAVGGTSNMTTQRYPQSYVPGWSTPQAVNPNGMGGVPMGATRSQPPMGTFDRHSSPFGGMPYQNHQNHGQTQNQHQNHHGQQPWVGNGQATTNGFGRGGYGGGAGGMHGPVGGM